MMRKLMLVTTALLSEAGMLYGQTDSVRLADVVVTGIRCRSDIRHLPLDVSVIGRNQLTASYQSSVLPTLNQQVPGLFVTTRGILGYGLGTGAAGTIKMRGVDGSADLLVFVHGENLMAQHYEVNDGFPMPRATVMAGVEVQL